MDSIRRVLLLALLALPLPGAALAQDDPVFTLYSTDPIVAHGSGNAYDNPYTDPGAVVYHDGKFHMFRNGFRGWPASVQWGYVTSADGYHWTKQGDAPLFMTDDVPYAGIAALASSALVLDDGAWVIYFYTYGNGGDSSGNWSIGRATAPAPTGPWRADPAPVLKPGGPGAWDNKIASPSVVRSADGYVMYYEGGEPTGTTMIGMARSKDGINWTKYDDPATGDSFAESDPVFSASTASDAWDRQVVDHPRVVQTAQGWVMLYRANQRRAGSQALGYALSDDGIHWTRYPQNPVLSWRLIPGGDGNYENNLLYQDDTFFAFFEVTQGNSSQIYLATHKGALPGAAAAAMAPPAQIPGSATRNFPQTGKSVAGLFLDYLDSHAGSARQGAPISDVLGETSPLDGKTYSMQYFEGAVFEYHPANEAPFDVLLSQLGAFRYRRMYPSGAADQRASSAPDAVLVPETGRHLGGPFLAYWRGNGGLMQFGYPISEEFAESAADGKSYPTQYFERAVLQYHAATTGGTVIALSLGSERYKQLYGAQ